jgi:hypothetical protein
VVREAGVEARGTPSRSLERVRVGRRDQGCGRRARRVGGDVEVGTAATVVGVARHGRVSVGVGNVVLLTGMEPSGRGRRRGRTDVRGRGVDLMSQRHHSSLLEKLKH